MYAFDYTRPAVLGEATKAFSGSDDASYMAGGMTLIPTLKQRLRRPSLVIDLAALADLKGLHREGSIVMIGALTTHAEVAASPVVRQAIPALADLAGLIGDP